MSAVYDRAAAKRSRGRLRRSDLPEGALDPIEGHEGAQGRGRGRAEDLLEAARTALAVAHPEAQIGILSAYRPATQQFQIWQGRNPKGKDEGSGFPHYYRRGDPAEARRRGRLQRGRRPRRWRSISAGTSLLPATATTRTGSRSTSASAEVGKRSASSRRGSWFHKWLKENATSYRFRAAGDGGVALDVPSAGQRRRRCGPARSELEVGAFVRAGEVAVPRVPLLARHRGSPPDLILRWNDMPSVPEEIDVVVHLHGFWYAG